jgi:hypothetical protein
MGLSGQSSSALSLSQTYQQRKTPTYTTRIASVKHCMYEDLPLRNDHLPRPIDTPGFCACGDLPWTEPKENTDSARLCEDHGTVTQDWLPYSHTNNEH